MFIRTKKIKKQTGVFEYAYVVENRRFRKNKIKQKSKKYLGRVYRFDRVNVMDFYEYYTIGDVDEYLDRGSVEKILLDVIQLELFNHGFEENKGVWQRGDCFFYKKTKKVINEKKNPIALAFNEGFLTSYAIKKILHFTAETEEDGYVFAKLFVEAGLAVPQDIFVGAFSKVYK